MPKGKSQSSGTLLYRLGPDGWTVLIVHPSGWYNQGKPWSIPKGMPNEAESLENAARRETWEETGVTPGTLVPLGSVKYRKSGKTVHCFAGPAPEVEPICASWEIDAAEYVSLEQARERLHPDQQAFIDRLMPLLST